MNKKKGLKYYAFILIFSSIILVMYMLYLRFADGELDSELFQSLAIVPLLFTSLLFVFDLIFDKLLPKRGKVGNVKFDTYLKNTSAAIQNECNFSIEEYTKLRSNQKFQKGLGQAFRVYDNGETKDLNIEFLKRKFKKETNEYVAFQIVIKEVEKLMEKL
jgi:hypothetical protein